MNELIKVTENKTGEQVVSGRELYNFLEVETKYTDWMKRMLEYGFEENKDYIPISQKREIGIGKGSIDYIISLDMAKEISMIQRTPRGKQARQYFIACERKLKSLAPRTYKDALLELVRAEEEKEQLLLENQKNQITIDHLREEIGFNKNYATVKKVEIYMKNSYRWKPLKDYSKQHGLEIKKVPDVNYGTVNAYHSDAWYYCYDIDLKSIFN